MAYIKTLVAVYVQIVVTFKCQVPCFWWNTEEMEQVSEALTWKRRHTKSVHKHILCIRHYPSRNTKDSHFWVKIIFPTFAEMWVFWESVLPALQPFSKDLIKKPMLLALRTRINVYISRSGDKTPFTSWRGGAGEKKRSQVSTHVFVHHLHVFHFKILQYTYPWIWKLNWLQIRPSVWGFILPKNKIPQICSVLCIFAFTSHWTHHWMYTLKEN